jgi:hypothetical protein
MWAPFLLLCIRQSGMLYDITTEFSITRFIAHPGFFGARAPA